MAAKWEELAARKRAALLASIPQEWRIPDALKPADSQADVTGFPRESGWFSARELEITGLGATALLEKTRSGTWSAVEVVKAFGKRASAAHQLLNCLSETLFESALQTAQELDDYLKEHGEPKGPLHGLPVSIKDHFNVEGVDSTVGFAAWVDQPATFNAVLVDMLRDLGAVLYIKTNVPTAMMFADTVNNVFGRTLNPLNRKLIPGGSSGGESALIAFCGSPLGVGSDIGGSLRIPAACTGLYTLKASSGRFPTSRTKSGLAGQEAVQSVIGPLARSLQDLELWARSIIGAQPWLLDPRSIPLPWRDVEKKAKLRIGIIRHDSVVLPTPPVRAALEFAVDRLQQAGHEVLEWPQDSAELQMLMGRFFTADGAKTVRDALTPTGEPFRPEMEAYSHAEDVGVYSLWQMQARRTELQRQYLVRWNEAGLDALLCPVTPFASVAPGGLGYLGYTGVFNVLDYSAVSFPSGVKASRDQVETDPSEPFSEFDAAARKAYDAEAVDGMPVSLQLVARRLEEEKVLMMTGVVVEALHGQA